MRKYIKDKHIRDCDNLLLNVLKGKIATKKTQTSQAIPIRAKQDAEAYYQEHKEEIDNIMRSKDAIPQLLDVKT